MATVTDVVSAQLERVEKKLQILFDANDQTISKLVTNKAKDVTISRYLYRIPFMQYRGGSYAKVDNNGGARPTGTSMKLSKFTAGYFVSNYGIQITQEMADTTATDLQSTVNVFDRQVAEAMLGARQYMEAELVTSGTGILTASSSASAASSLTFATAGDAIGLTRLFEGMQVDVWDSTGATKRATGSGESPTIISINYSTKVVTFDTTITGVTTGDILAFAGLDAYGPAALTSFSSTWPGGALTNGAGLTGDSWRHGIPYANDATGSNYYLGVLKSSIPQVLAANVAAASANLTYEMGLRLRDQIIQKRDGTVNNKSVWIGNMSQRRTLAADFVNISNFPRNQGNTTKMIDKLPANTEYDSEIEFAGRPFVTAKRQPYDRLDLITPSNYFLSQSGTIQFARTRDGKRFFEGRNSSGKVLTYQQAWIEGKYDFGCYDPGSQGYISGLNFVAA